MRQVIFIGLLLGACGGSPEPVPAKAPATAEPPPPRATSPVARGPVESLDRRDVIAAADAGLGYFLQRVEVEPELVDGAFKGFRVVDLRPKDWWAGVDLLPGDVVTQVNGMPIERETQAYAAFESLRSAKELRVSIIRNGQPRELVLPIVERGDQAKPGATGPL